MRDTGRTNSGSSQHSPRRPCIHSIRSRAGFTLIELLVVVAIIALLMAMMLPSLSKAKLLARRTVCMNNFKGLGTALAMYQGDYGDYAPICWTNMSLEDCDIGAGLADAHPWKSWRTSLLPYGTYKLFNCPTARFSELVKSEEDITCLSHINQNGDCGTTNKGSYGIIYQPALPGYKTVNCDGSYFTWTPDGSDYYADPYFNCAYSTIPGVAWTDPANSVYAADAYFANDYPCYPSVIGDRGCSSIIPPDCSDYLPPGALPVPGNQRRFADRHIGTNCLFLDGCVRNYDTKRLDQMKTGDTNCIWDVY